MRSRRGTRGCDLDVKMFLSSRPRKNTNFLFNDWKNVNLYLLGLKNVVKGSSPRREHLLLVELVELNLL